MRSVIGRHRFWRTPACPPISPPNTAKVADPGPWLGHGFPRPAGMTRCSMADALALPRSALTTPGEDRLRALGFSEFVVALLRRFNVVSSLVETWNIAPRDLVATHPRANEVTASRFLNSGEGLLFSRLIHDALRLPDRAPPRQIIDLACGSSLPSLAALREANGVCQLRGVDIDPDAVAVSRHNADVLGLTSRTAFVTADLLTFVRDTRFTSDTLLVANPPYVPVPNSEHDPFFLPVHGGPDGLRFVRAILDADIATGTRLVLIASSLASPRKLLERIAAGYQVVQLAAYLTPFGKYLKDERLAPYITAQRARGAISFGQDADGTRYFLTFGFVLEKT